ncbi:MAG: major capsid protein [Bacteroidales bacterium]|nr:major capsid protein [Bacteroidales bacterium]
MAFDYLHIPSFIAAIKEEKPFSTFLRDRYFKFKTAFATDEVLVEFKDGNKKLAPFVAPRVGGVTVKRDGYSAKTFAPAYIAPKRTLTIDELKKKRLGESIYPELTPADREAELILDDSNELDEMISRTEEWIASQLLVNASCTFYEKTENPDVNIEKEIFFYDGQTNDWIFTINTEWDDADADIVGDIAAMCRYQKSKGIGATELLVDAAAGAAILNNAKIQKLLDNRNFNVGEVDPQLVEYGVARLARLNCEGHLVDILQYVDEYEAEDGTSTPYIPYGTVILLAPDCGQSLYGAVTQLENDDQWHTYGEKRVPLILSSTQNQSKELRLASAPLLMPKRRHAWLKAQVVTANS